MSRHRRGFTLLELMITIVIISIIAVVAFPSMKDTLATNRLYGSTRSVVDVLAYARMQAIMRNQAHEVTISTSPTKPGGSVKVTRYLGNRCDDVGQRVPGVLKESQISRGVGLIEVRDPDGRPVAMTSICFAPTGRATSSGQPLPDDRYIALQRFKKEGDVVSPKIAWPLYARISHMGVAVLAKTIEDSDGGGEG